MEKKYLTMKEIMEALVAGKKIGCDYWEEDEYVCFNNDGVMIAENDLEMPFNGVDYNDKMYIYEEPKEKVELFLWAQYNGDDCYHTICNKFMDEGHAAMYLGKNAIKTNVSIVVEV